MQIPVGANPAGDCRVHQIGPDMSDEKMRAVPRSKWRSTPLQRWPLWCLSVSAHVPAGVPDLHKFALYVPSVPGAAWLGKRHQPTGRYGLDVPAASGHAPVYKFPICERIVGASESMTLLIAVPAGSNDVAGGVASPIL